MPQWAKETRARTTKSRILGNTEEQTDLSLQVQRSLKVVVQVANHA